MKPPSRLEFPENYLERPLEDDEVDRAEVEGEECMELTVTNRSKA